MLILVALFIVVPILELYVIIQIGGLIGTWPTLALLLADALLGSLLLRHQGRGAWERFNKALAERRFPGREVADGLLIAIGGTLLLAPGFLTDIVGLLFLIPPTRAIVRGLMKRLVGRRILVMGGPAGAAYGAASAGSRAYGYARRDPGGEAGSANGASREYDVEGTAEEIDPDDPQLPR
ncbi:MAG TPA: FxsA family protein [Solirubrobacterales bacterium]